MEIVEKSPTKIIITSEEEDGTPESVEDDKLWSTRNRYLWMFTLFIGQTFLYMTRAILPVCTVAIGNEFHWDKATMGALLGSFFWGYTLTQFIGGYTADHVGGEIVLAYSAATWGVLTILFPVLPNFVSYSFYVLTIMIGVRVLTGISQGFHNPSVGSLLAVRVTRNQRGLAFCVHSSGAHMGVLLSGAFGSLMLTKYSWRMPFLAIGVGGILWGILVRLYMVPKSPTKVVENPVPKTPIAWGSLLCNLSFWSLLVGHYAHSAAYFIILSWAPSYFHDNFPQAKSWVFNVVPWVVALPSALIAGLCSDWLLQHNYDLTVVRKLMESLSLLGTAAFLILLTFTDDYFLSILCIGLAIAFGSCHQGGIALNVLDIAPESGGAVFGIMNMAGSLPGFIGVYMAGYILERTHSWAAVFQQTSAVCVIGWLLYMRYGSTERIV